jgi:hypothetical protein
MKTFITCLFVLVFINMAHAQPSTITYQGVLTDNSDVLINETQNIKFELFGSLAGADLLWTETHNNIAITKGLFQVELNSINNNWSTANFASQMWLQITVGATTLTPRTKFNAGGYSLKSGTAISATNLLGGTAGSLPYQNAANTTAMLPVGTNGDVLTLSNGSPTWATPSGAGPTILFGQLTNQSFSGTGSYQEYNVPVSGAATGDIVIVNLVGVPASAATWSIFARAYVSASGNVRVYVADGSASNTIDSSLNILVAVIKNSN